MNLVGWAFSWPDRNSYESELGIEVLDYELIGVPKKNYELKHSMIGWTETGQISVVI